MRTLLFTGLLLLPIGVFSQVYWSTTGNNTTTGRIGIGTTTPDVNYDIDISRNTTGQSGMRMYNANVSGRSIFMLGQGSGSRYGYLAYHGESHNAGTTLGLTYKPASTMLVNSGPGGLGLLSVSDIRFHSGGDTESHLRMTVHSNGNVGIGSPAPQSKLDINHNVDGHTWNLQVSNEHHDYAGDQAVGVKLKLGDENESTKWAGVLGVSEGIWENYVGLAFYTNGYQSGSLNTEKMRITGNGSVGIGTSSPDAKLTVKGDIHTNEVRVDMNGAVAPDYVFENDYHLLPLPEVETYIKQNKHLPEVPSAKEMEATGINLKGMNLLLLKKVEELTLHLIEIKKENAAQQREIEILKVKK